MRSAAATIYVAGDPYSPVATRVLRVTRETHDTFTLTLDVAGWRGGFAFAPGQFNMVSLFGVGEVPISISGDPAESAILVHTIRAVGGVTRALAKVKKGGFVGVRGPYGSPWPLDVAKGRDVVMIAGGLGLAPLRPAICEVFRNRAAYAQAVVLVGARTPEDLSFARELARWERRRDAHVRVTVDRARAGWVGHVGVVPALLRGAPFDPARAVAFVCGPEVMMRFTVRDLNALGVSDDRIFVSLERSMKCGVGLCGHCQVGPLFLCKDGPVVRFDRARRFFAVREM